MYEQLSDLCSMRGMYKSGRRTSFYSSFLKFTTYEHISDILRYFASYYILGRPQLDSHQYNNPVTDSLIERKDLNQGELEAERAIERYTGVVDIETDKRIMLPPDSLKDEPKDMEFSVISNAKHNMETRVKLETREEFAFESDVREQVYNSSSRQQSSLQQVDCSRPGKVML